MTKPSYHISQKRKRIEAIRKLRDEAWELEIDITDDDIDRIAELLDLYQFKVVHANWCRENQGGEPAKVLVQTTLAAISTLSEQLERFVLDNYLHNALLHEHELGARANALVDKSQYRADAEESWAAMERLGVPVEQSDRDALIQGIAKFKMNLDWTEMLQDELKLLACTLARLRDNPEVLQQIRVPGFPPFDKDRGPVNERRFKKDLAVGIQDVLERRYAMNVGDNSMPSRQAVAMDVRWFFTVVGETLSHETVYKLLRARSS